MNLNDIERILALVEQSHFSEVDIRIGDVHIQASKNSGGGETRRNPQPEPSAGSAAAPAEPAPAQTAPPEPTAGPALEVDSLEGTVIRAPMLGVFYRASAPDADPYCEEGDLVKADSTLATIEVMKLFNSVRAGVKGRIVRILAENGAMVEFDQPLFVIQPE